MEKANVRLLPRWAVEGLVRLDCLFKYLDRALFLGCCRRLHFGQRLLRYNPVIIR